MEIFGIITGWKELYQTWDLRVVILFSLFLQIILTFLAPLRKRTASSFVMVPLWLAYLLADTTATFGIGLIAHAGTDKTILVAFWGPFLLLHLGGPDTITAFALEDNELWLRHLLQLVVQFGTCAYFLFLARRQNRLLFPSLLVYLWGFIKYVERTRCLYLASSTRLLETSLGEPDPGPSYDKFVNYFFYKKQSNIPTSAVNIGPRISRLPDRGQATSLSDLDLVLYAHRFFQASKALLADLVLSFNSRSDSQIFFLNRSSRDAFKVVEVELNFFYEILYTKAVVVHGRCGFVLRLFSMFLGVGSLVVFHSIDKQGFLMFDVGVTYSLLVGAISLELTAFLMVALSDWTSVSLSSSNHLPRVTRVLKRILNVDRKRWPEERASIPACNIRSPFRWFSRVIGRRWSESISQYNLIRYCLNLQSQWWKQTIRFFGLTILLDDVEIVKCNDELRDFIFEELKMKSKLTDGLKAHRDLYTAKGDGVLRLKGCSDLLHWITNAEFDETLLLWHIATELCFCFCDEEEHRDTETSPGPTKFRTMAKFLSDYMLYLLIIKSPILSSVTGIGHKRFRDTCAEAKRFFRKNNLSPDQKSACKKIWEVETAFRCGSIKGDSSKSLLFDGCILAKELEKLGAEKWEIVFKVWVEMLCYGACRCRASTHAAQLGKGGELITVVWLLMCHLGLGNQFQISDFQPRTMLVVGK